jgi:hypothetical protein
MGGINQKWAFAVAAEEENKRNREQNKKKPKRQGSKKMNPTSRKGKSKFRY